MRPEQNFSVTQSGKVGIGTNNPQDALHIFDSSGVGTLRVQGGNNVAGFIGVWDFGPMLLLSNNRNPLTGNNFKTTVAGAQILVGLNIQGLRTSGLGYTNTDSTRQRFTSKERDSETGLDYFLARYYSSAQGRFTSPDEFKGGPDELYVLGSGDGEKQALVYADITNAQSLNKYQYCFNNPLRYVDPDGHDGVTIDSDMGQRLVQGAAIAVGPTLIADGIHRARYEQGAKRAGSRMERKLLKADTRDNMSTFSQELSKTQDASRVGQEARHTVESARRTNPTWNKVGKGAKILGHAATGAAVVFAVYNVASAPAGQRVETAVVEVTTWAAAAAGASAGAKAGAAIGSFISPGLGTAIGAGAGAIIGGAGGAIVGSKVGEALVAPRPPMTRPINMDAVRSVAP